MYNRYIPQPDGSYRRRTIPDPKPVPKPPCDPAPVQEPEAPPCHDASAVHQPHHARRPSGSHRYRQKKQSPPKKPDCEDGFLRQLLPRDLDTGDFLVMALLLLMAGDSQDDKASALLTLALYLFL